MAEIRLTGIDIRPTIQWDDECASVLWLHIGVDKVRIEGVNIDALELAANEMIEEIDAERARRRCIEAVLAVSLPKETLR
jgi:hypothetical protein